MDVEHAALGARGRRGVRFINRDREAVNVQDAGQGKTAEASPDDRDRCCHLVLQGWIGLLIQQASIVWIGNPAVAE